MAHVPQDSLELDPSSPHFLDHVTRYWWAAGLAAGKRVLDCACGTGYGSYILSKRAASTLGIDLNAEAIASATRIFGGPGLRFERLDLFELAREPGSFDVITAFEVIEHIEPETTDRFLGALGRLLAPGGSLLLSTPNHDVALKSGVHIPPYHINNFRPAELRRKLGERFRSVRMLGQFRKRSGLAGLLYDLDYLNLRHVAAALARGRGRGAGSGPDIRTGGVPPASRAEAEVRAWFDAPPAGAAEYLFSDRHWRQSGLSVAVCADARTAT